jgi:citrate/tricarballylate utilization protein
VVLDAAQSTLDAGFTWLLLATSITGLALLFLRDTGAMPLLLAIHLGVVLALFLTLPYGKFVHGLYRYLALARSAREKPQTTVVAE